MDVESNNRLYAAARPNKVIVRTSAEVVSLIRPDPAEPICRANHVAGLVEAAIRSTCDRTSNSIWPANISFARASLNNSMYPCNQCSEYMMKMVSSAAHLHHTILPSSLRRRKQHCPPQKKRKRKKKKKKKKNPINPYILVDEGTTSPTLTKLPNALLSFS